jgi:hypothetical protein
MWILIEILGGFWTNLIPENRNRLRIVAETPPEELLKSDSLDGDSLTLLSPKNRLENRR